MSVDVRPELIIRRPRGAVAAYMFDPTRDAEWTAGVISCRPLTEGRLKTGSQVERTVKFLGRTFSYLYEVVDAAGDDFVELRVTQPFPMHVRYELADAPEGTRVAIHARGDATGFFRLAAPLMGGMVRRNITRDLELLKEILERAPAG